MRTLYLLRHAKSSWADSGLDDHDRPLNARGLDACARLIPYIRQHGVAPDLVLCSTAERTRATLQGIFSALPVPLQVVYDPALYLGTPERIMALIRAVPASVQRLMVVGHNPGLEDLAALLAGDGPADLLAQIGGKFPTGALAALDFGIDSWDALAAGGGRLRLFAVPRLLPE